MKTKLYVGNLSYSIDDNELRAAFEPHGRVVAADVVMDRTTGQSRGFGFVEFETAEAAESAAQALDGSSLGGRSINVNVARDRGSAPRKAGNGRSW